MSSNFSLLIVNLFVGLCRGSAGLPKVLRELGYEDRWIERQFTNQDRDRVHPEVVIASRLQRHTLLVEAKRGPNTDRDQLRRYARVEGGDLIERLFLAEEEAERHDVAVVGLHEYADRLRIALEEDGTRFPLLVADDEGLWLAVNEFSCEELTDVFRPRMHVRWDEVPMGWIPFDHDSELWEVAEVVIPRVIGRMVDREPRVGARSVCDAVSSWSIIGTPQRRQMEARVLEVFREASAEEFREYFTVHDSDLVVVENPVDLEGATATQGFQKLQRLQGEFLHRLRAEGMQLNLFA